MVTSAVVVGTQTAIISDLQMLAMTAGGRQRTGPEHRTLLAGPAVA
ncbi:MAG: hypothetical protein M3Y48_00735 [Actinomycetota bacterium]|nr:hypothetical protein [Actinomycetota bacterium]